VNAPDKDSFYGLPSDLIFKQHLQNSLQSGGLKVRGWVLKARQDENLMRLIENSGCAFCNKNKSTAVNTQLCQACLKDQQGVMMQKNLSKKYSTNRDYYNLKIVNDLIYNENTHIVSIFKDYLILDDINEFLKRSYNIQETKVRLPKLCSFYDKYSQVFPNYVVLPESKYMFKNI